MANEKNLIPLSQRTPQERKEISRKGAEATNAKLKQRKAMKEQMEMLLSLPLKDDKAKAKLKELGINTDDINNQMALVVTTYKEALKGNTKAINIVREMIGERVQQISIETNVDDKVKELNDILDDIE